MVNGDDSSVLLVGVDQSCIACGVPQESSLGPLFFLLYVNNLPLASNFETTLFADDTYLRLFDNNLEAVESGVNYKLNKIKF